MYNANSASYLRWAPDLLPPGCPRCLEAPGSAWRMDVSPAAPGDLATTLHFPVMPLHLPLGSFASAEREPMSMAAATAITAQNIFINWRTMPHQTSRLASTGYPTKSNLVLPLQRSNLGQTASLDPGALHRFQLHLRNEFSTRLHRR